MTAEKNLYGIKGWLKLVAIVIVVSPIRITILVKMTYSEIFSLGGWEELTTQGGEFYSPLLGPFLIREILINSGVVLVWLYMAYLFFWGAGACAIAQRNTCKYERKRDAHTHNTQKNNVHGNNVGDKFKT